MKRILFCILPLCLSAPLLAQAADGYVVADISLQAGPDTEYPAITELAAGTPVQIQGCINGYTWCDVIAGEDRGWVAGSFVQEEYDNQPVIIEDYGPRIGIPIVAFSLGVYWEQHYHSRPFYGQRTQWEGRRIQPHQPPRPSAEAIRNAPHPGGQRAGGGRPGERPAAGEQHPAPPPPKPVSGPVAPPPRPAAEAGHQEAKPAPVKTRADVQREHVQPAHPVAPAAHPAPEVKPAPPRPAPVAHAAPAPKAKPKAEPKPEPKKDDGGHKDDSKDH